MNEEKKNCIEFLKKIGRKCTECGKFFIALSIDTSTEYNQTGFDKIYDYTLDCGKCPECAEDCFYSLYEYTQQNGKAPCDEHLVNYKEYYEDIEDYLKNLQSSEGYVECYPYTETYRNQYHTSYDSVLANFWLDITEIILKKFPILKREDL